MAAQNAWYFVNVSNKYASGMQDIVKSGGEKYATEIFKKMKKNL